MDCQGFAILKENEKSIDELRLEISLAMQLIQQMRRRMFGANSDKVDPGQQTFASLLQKRDALNGGSAPTQAKTRKIVYEREKPSERSNLNGKVKIPPLLDRVDKIVDLPDSEKICPVTGLPMVRKG